MTDDDIASQHEQFFLEIALRKRKPVEIEAIGICHNCEEPITEGYFCNSECRDDFEKIQKQKTIRGER